MHTGNAMSKSITWGAIVGVALGATITFALSRGWLSLPWAQAAAREAVHGAVLEDGPAAPLPHSDPARPLRPGGERIGVAPPALSRS